MRRAFVLSTLIAVGPVVAAGTENLALGKPVTFAPSPRYRLTMKGDTDATDLTDGKLTLRKDSRMWFDKTCVGWSYGGLSQFSVDLGRVEPVGEVAVRLLGGAAQAGITLPGWVEVVVSVDGKRFHKVASYSKWTPGDRAKFRVPRNEGKAWAHKLVFPDLNVRARHVGLSFSGTGLNAADEVYVMRGQAEAAREPSDAGPSTSFTTSGVLIYFHKPTLSFTSNIHTPNPIGVTVAEDMKGKPVDVLLDLPKGVTIAAGRLAGVDMTTAEPVSVGAFIRYTVQFKAKTSQKSAGRVYLAGDWADGQTGVVRYQTKWPGGATPLVSHPIQAIVIPKCPRPSKRLMLGLGWWSLDGTRSWPDARTAFGTIGFNTVPMFARYSKPDSSETQAFVSECLARGLKTVNVDSPFHHMLHKHRKDKAMFCPFADGSVGKRMCPCYRGPHYQAEVERLARESAAVKASYVTCDIELWNWRGPIDAKKCTRCQERFRASGQTDIVKWQQDVGFEIWRDLSEAMRAEMTRAGLPMPDLGGYDFEAGKSYQFFWPFDRLYPEHMSSAQVSTYTPLEPYHLSLIGDRVRHNRAKLPKSDVLPWLTPGDAGVFSGEAFRLALLECFANGARGVYFWSGRVWDSDTLAGFAHAIRNVAPVEDIIADGQLLAGASAEPDARVSGMCKGDEMLVLVADYYLTEPRTVSLRLPARVASVVVDQDTGEQVGEVGPGAGSVALTLGPARARLLVVRPQ